MCVGSFVERNGDVLLVKSQRLKAKVYVAFTWLILSRDRNLIDDFGGFVVPFPRIEATGV